MMKYDERLFEIKNQNTMDEINRHGDLSNQMESAETETFS